MSTQTPEHTHPLQISEYDNIWNQLAVELAKPHLNWHWQPDEKKVRSLKERLKELYGERHGNVQLKLAL